MCWRGAGSNELLVKSGMRRCRGRERKKLGRSSEVIYELVRNSIIRHRSIKRKWHHFVQDGAFSWMMSLQQSNVNTNSWETLPIWEGINANQDGKKNPTHRWLNNCFSRHLFSFSLSHTHTYTHSLLSISWFLEGDTSKQSVDYR